MTIWQRITSFFTLYRLALILLFLQILFLTQLSYIWLLGTQLREQQQKMKATIQEEKIITPEMVRGMR
ncbi:hypothetical protein A2160_01010 [Candidatus Beckwithbacteria bacterium RBG_13_42_9]|uniref:Uncharacterized protein n=1 Tax=Candidatus Beckwithbacteria bacterium RBG_13_42_9 TaxID=1797457 RepID=A0A1F5E856_9BACT|nr:MAG: hypothetical protein A2160_01010 [Candidatus Beckwithbacteria bacterium RBG_13_42_9]